MRVNLTLAAALVLCAIALVTAQHKARRLFTQFEQEQNHEKQLNIEHGQLQLEQSTWALHSRVERIAAERLHMRPLDPRRAELVNVPPPDDSIAQR